ncbi:6-hydroxymethylpterin diphosphokinase MptE-like protein [Terasakiella sp.]|uniref:motility associated factor glycosyltransferase family protein n=1 Tax=Terasakiella sp. TaxID=2034861 RepID=UPI003AA955FD
MLSLFEKNVEFFKNNDIFLYKRIEPYLDNLAKNTLLHNADGEPVNIKLGQVNLYGTDADVYSKAQLKDYFDAPNRMAFPSPDHCNISDVSFGLFRKMQEFAKGRELDKGWIKPLQVVDSGYFFCSGIGLGYHISDIVSRNLTRVYIFSEPIIEFFLFSFDVVNWADVYKTAENNGASVHIVLTGKANELVYQIENIIHNYSISFIEGSYFYAHYASWDTQETLNLLRERMEGYTISSGFYEDELLMMINTYYNFKHTDFRFLKKQKMLDINYPVFVIGSGPSLEYDLDQIKRLRSKAIVISCGTTIRLLLKNGIRPDIHVENENGWKTEKILSAVKKEYGLEGIILACSSTTFPGVQQLFDEVWCYVRPALSATSVFAKPTDSLKGVSPMVVNAGAGVAYNLGFRKIYLFGADCGKAKDAKSHHKDALYHDDLGKELGFTEKQLNDIYVKVVPGNFGGEFLTSHFLDMSRICLSDLNRQGRSNLVNCSRGAKIESVPAMSSAAITFDEYNEKEQAFYLDKIRQQFPFYKAGDKLKEAELSRWRDACPEFKKDLRKKLKPLIKTVDNFWEIDVAIKEFWNDNIDKYRGILIIISGSYANMVRLASYLGSRIENEGLRKEFLIHSMTKYLEICDWMVDQIEELYNNMLNEGDRIEMPERYEGGYDTHVEKEG